VFLCYLKKLSDAEAARFLGCTPAELVDRLRAGVAQLGIQHDRGDVWYREN
jgi:hypothetical protein